MSMLEQMLKEKNWTLATLARKYGEIESPGLGSREATRKYGSLIRKAVLDPDSTKHATIKQLVEILGGEMIVRVKREEEIKL